MRASHGTAAVLGATLCTLALSAYASTPSEDATIKTEAYSPASSIVASIDEPALRRLLAETLGRNPSLAVALAQARASDQRPAQAGALPDPTLGLTVFLLEPQTRVGPQQASATISQRLPWFGKLKLEEQAALLVSTAASARVEEVRIELITKIRKLYHELQYLAREERVVTEEQSTLGHYEELAQARYASGVGIGQTVIKIQAEITRTRARLLGIEQRRATLLVEVNALRDQPSATPVPVGDSAMHALPLPSIDNMCQIAQSARPELAAALALVEAAELRISLAEKNRRPDVTVGLTYALVGKRSDTAGQLNPPEGNGDDIFGLSGGITLPIWRNRLNAGVEEAVQKRFAADSSRRAITAQIKGELTDLARRIPLLQEQLNLFDDILTVQAEESLRSAEVAYASGTASALDLLDAERVLLGVRIGAERSRTDLSIAIAQLEGALASPLAAVLRNGSAI